MSKLPWEVSFLEQKSCVEIRLGWHACWAAFEVRQRLLQQGCCSSAALVHVHAVLRFNRPRLDFAQAKAGQAYDSAAQGAKQAQDYTQVGS